MHHHVHTHESVYLTKGWNTLVPNLDRRRKILMDFYAWLPFFKVSPIMLKANVQAYSIQKDLEKGDCNLQEHRVQTFRYIILRVPTKLLFHHTPYK